MSDYKLTANGVLRTADAAWIPNNPRNGDWQAYQDWLRTPGNTPDPADAAPASPTPAQLAQAVLDDPTDPRSIFIRGLVQVLATRFSLTPAQIIAAVKAAAS